ncbi:MAG: hypothetical protein ACYTFV_03585 [Planctomycetota bacterium]|jgi:hypothetical protein
MQFTTTIALALACLLPIACGGTDAGDPSAEHSHDGHSHDGHSHDGHSHDGHTHDGTSTEHGHSDEANEHDHDEVPLGSVEIGDLTVELAQGHGGIAAGKESHLVVKLPYADAGATAVRAWIGTEDRTLSLVGKAEYAAAHDDYDLHATAPDPLPEGAQWWIEIERPDGTRALGSAVPILD